MSKKTVFTELSKETLENFLVNLNEEQAILIKFGATWCGPCQKIKNLCEQNFSTFSDNLICVDLDVDDNFEIYGHYKVKKQINGIPKIMVYYGKNSHEKWFLPDDSVSGSDHTEINNFFNRIRKYVK